MDTPPCRRSTHYAIDESLIERDLQRGETLFATETPSLSVAAHDYHLAIDRRTWLHWQPAPHDRLRHPHYDEIEAWLKERAIPYRIDRAALGLKRLTGNSSSPP